MECSLQGSSVLEISRARILEWVALSYFKESSHPGIKPMSSALASRVLYHWTTRGGPVDPVNAAKSECPDFFFYSSLRITLRSGWGRGFPYGSAEKNLPAMQKTKETWGWSLGRDDPLEKEMATHSSILAWEIPWTEEPGGLQSIGSQRVGHDWSDRACTGSRNEISLFPVWTSPGDVIQGAGPYTCGEQAGGSTICPAAGSLEQTHPILNVFSWDWGTGRVSSHPQRSPGWLCHHWLKIHPKCLPVTAGHKLILHTAGSL